MSFATSSTNSKTDRACTSNGASTSASTSSSFSYFSSQPATQACAACKYQRRKCSSTCLLAPYFPANKQRQFLNAHRHFGISKILRIIRHLDGPHRSEAMATIVYESEARARDPVGGCLRIVLDLEHDLQTCSAELGVVRQLLAVCRGQAQEPHPSDTGVQYHMLFNTDNGVHTNDNYFSQTHEMPPPPPLPPPPPPPPPPPSSSPPPHYYNYICFDGVDNNGLDNNHNRIGVDLVGPDSILRQQQKWKGHAFAVGGEAVDSKDMTAYQSSNAEQEDGANSMDHVRGQY